MCAPTVECSTKPSSSPAGSSPAPSATSYLARGYAPHDPPECTRDEDCGSGCCSWIGVDLRKCQTGSACTLQWITLPPSGLPRWAATTALSYTGSLEADVVHSQVGEDIKSGQYLVHVLANGQYWQDMGLNPAALAGEDVVIVPARFWFDMYVGKSTSPVPVRQLPVVLDTQVVDPGYTGIQPNGVHQVNGAGYWKVFSEAKGSSRRALLATPNNVDFWMFTEGRDENHCDPVESYGEGIVSLVAQDGFGLSNGQQWSYVVNPGTPLPAMGDRVVIYLNALVNIEEPDTPLISTYWIDGKRVAGVPWVERVR